MSLLSCYTMSEQMAEEGRRVLPAKGGQGGDVQKHLQCWCISDAPLCSSTETQRVQNTIRHCHIKGLISRIYKDQKWEKDDVQFKNL